MNDLHPRGCYNLALEVMKHSTNPKKTKYYHNDIEQALLNIDYTYGKLFEMTCDCLGYDLDKIRNQIIAINQHFIANR